MFRSRPAHSTPTSVSTCLAVLLALVGGAVSAAQAADDAQRRLGLRLAEEGRCDAALEVFSEVQGTPPDDAEVARLDGLCALRLQDFRRAITSLEAARSLAPGKEDVDLSLAIAYYHADRLDEAESALARIPAAEQGRGEVLLYSGLIALSQSDFGDAVGRLDAASQLSDAPVEPMASFFLGRAELGAENEGQARSAFERVLRDHPDTPWAEEAQRALDDLDGGAYPWWASVEAGIEWDDNALLRGRGVGLPSEVSDQSDWRGFWFADAGAQLLDFKGFTGGVSARFAGSAHHDLDDFDTLSPGATVWIDRPMPFADTSLRLQYDFDAPFIDRDLFVVSHLVGASLYKPWDGGRYTLFGTSVGFDDYRYERFDSPDTVGGPTCGGAAPFCGPPVNELDGTDRDGRGVSASVLHHEPMTLPLSTLENAWIEGEYRYQQYWSEGSEYDHQRHQVELGIGLTLPLEIGLQVRGRYAYVPYGNRTVFPDADAIAAATATGPGTPVTLSRRNRREQEVGVRVSLERSLTDDVLIRLRYSRTRNISTADVFQYTRDLVGLSVRVGLGG